MERLLQLRVNGLNPCSNGRYSQSDKSSKDISDFFSVLILVLMEDTLRVVVFMLLNNLTFVLILVLMENTLRVLYFLCVVVLHFKS